MICIFKISVIFSVRAALLKYADLKVLHHANLLSYANNIRLDQFLGSFVSSQKYICAQFIIQFSDT